MKAKQSAAAKAVHAARRASAATSVPALSAQPVPSLPGDSPNPFPIGTDTSDVLARPPGSGTAVPLISVTGPTGGVDTGDDLGPGDVHPMSEIGVSGIAQYAGRIYDEFLKSLQGDRGIRVYREMSDNDPIVGALLYAIEMYARQVDWRVEGDPEQAEFVWECLHDMSLTWSDTLSAIFQMLIYGFEYEEVVYKKRNGFSDDATQNSKHDDGKIGWMKWATRAQETRFKWVFDNNGEILGMIQLAPPRYQLTFIPIEKSLLFRTTARRGNPEGRSVLRTAYRPWYFKKRIEEIEAIGIERDLAGLPVAWIPPSYLSGQATPEQLQTANEFKRIVRNVRRDEQEGVVMPLAYDDGGRKLFDLTLLTSGGRRQFDTSGIIQRYNQSITMTVLADFILLGHESVGSFALGAAKIDLFSAGLATWLKNVAETINTQAIPRLFKLNGVPLAADPPRLVPGEVQQIDLAVLGAFVQALAGSGAPLFPDMDLEDYLRGVAGMPTIDRDAREAADAEAEAQALALVQAEAQARIDSRTVVGDQGLTSGDGEAPAKTPDSGQSSSATPLPPQPSLTGHYRGVGPDGSPTPPPAATPAPGGTT